MSCAEPLSFVVFCCFGRNILCFLSDVLSFANRALEMPASSHLEHAQTVPSYHRAKLPELCFTNYRDIKSSTECLLRLTTSLLCAASDVAFRLHSHPSYHLPDGCGLAFLHIIHCRIRTRHGSIFSTSDRVSLPGEEFPVP